MTDTKGPSKAKQIIDDIKSFREKNSITANTTHTMTIEEYSLIYKVLGLYFPKYTVEVNNFTYKIIIPTKQ